MAKYSVEESRNSRFNRIKQSQVQNVKGDRETVASQHTGIGAVVDEQGANTIDDMNQAPEKASGIANDASVIATSIKAAVAIKVSSDALIKSGGLRKKKSVIEEDDFTVMEDDSHMMDQEGSLIEAGDDQLNDDIITGNQDDMLKKDDQSEVDLIAKGAANVSNEIDTSNHMEPDVTLFNELLPDQGIVDQKIQDIKNLNSESELKMGMLSSVMDKQASIDRMKKDNLAAMAANQPPAGAVASIISGLTALAMVSVNTASFAAQKAKGIMAQRQVDQIALKAMEIEKSHIELLKNNEWNTFIKEQGELAKNLNISVDDLYKGMGDPGITNPDVVVMRDRWNKLNKDGTSTKVLMDQYSNNVSEYQSAVSSATAVAVSIPDKDMLLEINGKHLETMRKLAAKADLPVIDGEGNPVDKDRIMKEMSENIQKMVDNLINSIKSTFTKSPSMGV